MPQVLFFSPTSVIRPLIDARIFSNACEELWVWGLSLECAVVGLAIFKLDLLFNLVGLPGLSIIKILAQVSIIELIPGTKQQFQKYPLLIEKLKLSPPLTMLHSEFNIDSSQCKQTRDRTLRKWASVQKLQACWEIRVVIGGKYQRNRRQQRLQQLMGMSSPNNSVFVYYGETLHPLLGKGSAYSISGQGGKFMMKAQMRTSLPQLELIEKIGRCANPRLVGYFGFQHRGGLFWDKQDVQILWELFSYNLSQEINYLRILQKQMEEDLIWQIIACLVQACKFLRNYHIYPDLELAKVEFSAAKEPKLFWADIMPQNMHRAYERCANSHQFRQALYSPEQLVEINRQQILEQLSNHKIVDKEKCVVFSIGMIMLECIWKKGVQTIYEYDNKAFSEVKKREILNEIPTQYSPELSEVLQACLQYFPKDRYDYQNLQTKINKHFLRQKRFTSNQILENTEPELK